MIIEEEDIGLANSEGADSKRKAFQIHLGTCVSMVLCASAILFLNLSPRKVETQFFAPSTVFVKGQKEEFGWPLWCYSTIEMEVNVPIAVTDANGNQPSDHIGLRLSSLALDSVVGILILLAVFCAVEVFVYRSLRRDWKTLRGKKVEAKAVVETKSGEA